MNQRSSPKGVRERIFRAIASGPANFTSIHRTFTSPLQQQTNSAKLTPPPFPVTSSGGDEEAAIPINFDYTSGQAQDNSKPTNKYASFDDFILQTKRRIMLEEEEAADKVVVMEFGKNHRFSD
ncbi:hypothetical protein V6N13_146845 [Hibiscus sabdariffa]